MLVLGGTRSGKSLYAERLAAARQKESGGKVLYVATAGTAAPDGTPDPAMLERVRKHRERRPADWETLECPLRLGEALEAALAARAAEDRPAVVLVDCVTLWLSNLLLAVADGEAEEPKLADAARFERTVTEELAGVLRVAERFPCLWIFVSGETGLGLIAPTPLGRLYCDGLGLANQILADSSDKAFFMVAGRALVLPPPDC